MNTSVEERIQLVGNSEHESAQKTKNQANHLHGQRHLRFDDARDDYYNDDLRGEQG